MRKALKFCRVPQIHRNPKVVVLAYDMRSYAKGIVEFNCELTGTAKSKLRNVSAPCLPESNMTDAEVASEGTIQPFAARILMRCLWTQKLAWPDISFAVQRLASRVTRSEEFVMKAAVEPDQVPELLVYTDSDFASCPFTAKSTSGMVYILRTGSSCLPLLWSSLARSTTEAELIACASALFGEALNFHTMIDSLAKTIIPSKFQHDNPAAITVIRAGYSSKLRHAGRVHRVNVTSINEQLAEGVFDLEYCGTTSRLANGFTKVISATERQHTLKQLCLSALSFHEIVKNLLSGGRGGS